MPQYAILKNGVFDRGPILAEPDFDPGEGFTKVAYDAEVHFKPSSPPRELWVDQYRFIAELHTREQQDLLDAAREEANRLTNAELKSQDMQARSFNNYPIWALKVLRKSEQFMTALGGRVNVLSDNMGFYYQAAITCGIFGPDFAAAALEVERIKRNETPAS